MTSFRSVILGEPRRNCLSENPKPLIKFSDILIGTQGIKKAPAQTQVNTMSRSYIALIHKDADSDCGVSFPDLPGVITAGSNLDEARRMAAEALAFHLQGMAEDGEAVPDPSSLEEIMAIAENKDGVAVLIDAPEAEVK
jgi:predicted RNase H-like HicB family nuclease